MRAIDIRHLSARYDRATVLHDVSLTVDEGEIVAVLGANGAGKTTLLRSIDGSVDRSGSVVVLGSETVGRAPHQIVRLGMAHVPEGRGTFTSLTVLDNLRIGAYTRRDRQVRRDIEHFLDRFPALHRRQKSLAGSLSGGEQQMLAIARAMMMQPKVLLLDEPSLGLAPQTRAEVFADLRLINERDHIAILLVEQNAQAALDISHRAYVVEGGTVASHGASVDLVRDDSIRQIYLGV